MSVDESIAEYERLGKEIFGRDKSFQKATAFSATYFEFIIRKIIERRTGNVDALLLYKNKPETGNKTTDTYMSPPSAFHKNHSVVMMMVKMGVRLNQCPGFL
jgi:hypothetical protein